MHAPSSLMSGSIPNNFEATIADNHLQALCANAHNAQDLFLKMKRVQHFYNMEKAQLAQQRTHFLERLRQMLGEQYLLRPSAQQETELKMNRIEEQMEHCLHQLQWKCNRLIIQLQMMNQRTKRRRNLPPEAVAILREWFDCHNENPYPSEAEKGQLARRATAASMNQVQISLQQVTTWFVNARARYPWGKPASPVALAGRPMIAAGPVQPGQLHSMGLMALPAPAPPSGTSHPQSNATAWSLATVPAAVSESTTGRVEKRASPW